MLHILIECNLKNDRMISVRLQGKPFNITVIQVYAPACASLVAQRLNRLASNAGDLGSIPGSGRSPGEGNGNPLQYSCLENPTDGEA